MTADLQYFLDSKLFVAIFCGAIGFFANRLLDRSKNRIQKLEYTVNHDRVGISLDDPIFGSLKVTLNGRQLVNLFYSTVTLTNTTTKDLKDVVVKVYTSKTQLLSQHVSIKDSTFVPQFTESYSEAILVPPGEEATPVQITKYFNTREYLVPVLNRGQSMVLQYLTCEPNAPYVPGVWAEVLQEGIGIMRKEIVPEFIGVPLKHAVIVGLVTSLIILAIVSYLSPPVWLAAAITLITGLSGVIIGAWLCKLAKSVVRFFID